MYVYFSCLVDLISLGIIIFLLSTLCCLHLKNESCEECVLHTFK